jgi:MATE family multidrug resistance protein
MMLSVMPSMGIAQAVMTRVGQYLGEGKPAKAQQTTWDGVKICSIYMACVALSFFLIPDFYLSWFKNQDNAPLWAEVSRIAPVLLQIVGIFTIADSMYLNVSFALKGAGDTKFVSWVALTVPWPFMVLPAFLVKDFNNAVVWAWSFVILYSFVITSVLVLRFRGGKWKTMSVIREG